MKPNVSHTIFAEYHAPDKKFTFSAETDSGGLNLVLTLRDINPVEKVKQVTITNCEFSRLAEKLGYKMQ